MKQKIQTCIIAVVQFNSIPVVTYHFCINVLVVLCSQTACGYHQSSLTLHWVEACIEIVMEVY